MSLKNKNPKNKRLFSSDDKKTIFIRGEYTEFQVSKDTANITLHDEIIGSTDIVKIIDLTTNKTIHFTDVENLKYEKDLGMIPITRQEPIPVATVIDVENSQKNNIYSIDTKDLLKNQIDFNTNKFKVTGVYNPKGGEVELKDEQIIFKADSNYKGVMSFRYTFENEYGQSVIDKVPTLLRTPDLPQDEKFIQQLWYLESVNVIPVWNKYTGKGVKVAVYDSSFFPSHSDIDNNVIHKEGVSMYNRNIDLHQHALQVASIIASERNDKFYVGIAYNAKIGSYQAFGSDRLNHNDLDFFLEYDVINNSWGSTVPFSWSKEYIELHRKDFKNTVTLGRDGLGSLITFASGNGGGSGVDSNCDGIASGPYTITVGGINKPIDLLFMEKQAPYFASHGANILVSAPSSNICLLSNDNFAISNSVDSQDSNTINTQGTSFSAPIVSGIIALMLEANPKLGYRDVQEILAASADLETNNLLPQWRWQHNKANNWNGGGYHFSHQYGFGRVNAQAAVKLAESWPTEQTIKNLKTIQGQYQTPYGKVTSLASYQIEIPQNILVEHVEQNVNLVIQGNIQDVNLYLKSPGNTTSRLMYNFLHKPATNEKLSSFEIFTIFKMQSLPTVVDWSFGSTNFRGEESKGKWTFAVEIKKDNPSNQQSEAVYITALDIKIYGKVENTLKQMIYTDEFRSSIEKSEDFSQNRQSILQEQKIDIINGAALSSGIGIDLGAGIAVIDKVKVNLDKNLKFKGIIGTDHNDKFVISDNQKISLILRDGNDVVEFTGDNNIVTLQKQAGAVAINHFEESFILDGDNLQAGYCWQLKHHYINENIIILDNSLSIDDYYG